MAPGTYTLRLTFEGEQVETEAIILPNPAIDTSPLEFTKQQEMLIVIEHTLREMHQSVNQMRSAKKQLNSYAKLLEDNDQAKALLEKGEALTKRINSWEEHLIQSKQKTFQDVINFNNKLNAQLIQLKGYMDQADPKVTQGARERFNDLMKDWQVYRTERDAIIGSEMKAYNNLYRSLNLPALILDKE